MKDKEQKAYMKGYKDGMSDALKMLKESDKDKKIIIKEVPYYPYGWWNGPYYIQAPEKQYDYTIWCTTDDDISFTTTTTSNVISKF